MIGDKQALMDALDRLASGAVYDHDVSMLRNAVQRLDEMDDLVDAVCSCRTAEIPVLRLKHDQNGGRS